MSHIYLLITNGMTMLNHFG